MHGATVPSQCRQFWDVPDLHWQRMQQQLPVIAHKERERSRGHSKLIAQSERERQPSGLNDTFLAPPQYYGMCNSVTHMEKDNNSGTSDKGPSEIGTISLQRCTCFKPILILYLTSEIETTSPHGTKIIVGLIVSLVRTLCRYKLTLYAYSRTSLI